MHPVRSILLLLGFAWALVAPAAVAYAETTPKPPTGRFLGAKPTEYPSWFKESFLDFAEDVREAGDRGKRVLVLFHQDGCPYCNALVERNLSQKDIEEQVRAKFDVVALNMWGDREVVSVDGQAYTEKQFARALRVQFTPTLLFFNEQGGVALRVDGYLPPTRFKLALDYVTGRMEQDLTYREFLEKQAPAADAGALHREDFFTPPPFDLSAPPDGRPVAVFFEQTQCPNCDSLHEYVLTDPETRTIVTAFHSVQLDMWSKTPLVTPSGEHTTARDWARELDVKYAPTIVLFDDGIEVIRSEAFFKIFHTQSIFDYVRSAAYREQPSFQRYISARAEHIREQGRDVDIWR